MADSNDLVKLGALWTGKTKAGEPMMTGKLGDARVVVFKNKYKEKDSQPDYILYLTNPNPKPKEDAEPVPENKGEVSF